MSLAYMTYLRSASTTRTVKTTGFRLCRMLRHQSGFLRHKRYAPVFEHETRDSYVSFAFGFVKNRTGISQTKKFLQVSDVLPDFNDLIGRIILHLPFDVNAVRTCVHAVYFYHECLLSLEIKRMPGKDRAIWKWLFDARGHKPSATHEVVAAPKMPHFLSQRIEWLGQEPPPQA